MAKTHKKGAKGAAAPGKARDVRRKQLFLEHLAVSSNVAASARKAKAPISTLYLWRSNDADFCAEWLKALETGYALLESMMLHRAQKGVLRRKFYQDKLIDTVREYDDAMSFRLLQAHRDTVATMRAISAQLAGEERSEEDVAQSLRMKLDMMRERLLIQQVPEQIPEALPAHD